MKAKLLSFLKYLFFLSLGALILYVVFKDKDLDFGPELSNGFGFTKDFELAAAGEITGPPVVSALPVGTPPW